MTEMGSESPDRFGSPVIMMTEEEQQQQQQQDIGCLINSDGEEVDLSDLRKSITPSLVGSLFILLLARGL